MSSTPVSGGTPGKKKWAATSLLFRNSSSGDSGSRAPSSRSEKNGDAAAIATYDDTNDSGDDEDDPLLSLFRVHNTNRVRFDLTPSSSADIDRAPSSLYNESNNVITNDYSEHSNNSNKSNNQSSNPMHKMCINNQQLPSIQDKFKKLIIRSNSNSGEHGGGAAAAAPPPILLNKTSSNLNPSSVKSNYHGITNGSGDDAEDAYIKKLLEPTPIRRISSFLTNGNYAASGGCSSGGNLAAKKTATASVVKDDNDDNNSGINSSLSVDGNHSPNRVHGGSSRSTDKRDSNRRRFRHSRNPLFRTTKCNETNVAALLKKARYAHNHSFRYQLAMRYYLLALKEITSSSPSGYSVTTNADHPLVAHILKSLNDVHHAQVTLSNSTNIVQMGIQHEDANQLVKALRMYTIAYRMRRDALGVNHPSLAVLLNMMGGVQMKRMDYEEAMRLYELSLNGRQDENGGKGRNVVEFRNRNPLTTSGTLRDMGLILEQKGKEDKALVLYHASLRYAVKFIEDGNSESKRSGCADDSVTSKVGSNFGNLLRKAAPQTIFGDSSRVKEEEDAWLENFDNGNIDSLFSLEEVRMESTSSTAATVKFAKSGTTATAGNSGDDDGEKENGEMEVFLEKRFDNWALSENISVGGGDATPSFYYDGLCLPPSDESITVQSKQGHGETYFDIALTLHQIGQIHRRGRRCDAALSAYKASLRGMKQVLGSHHGIIAAILGNIGNLHMENGNLDAAYNVYQEVLGMETTLLGLSHPEVAVTLHNIATIECSRGNFSDGASLFRQVVDMQKLRFGNEHLTVAITLSCLADAYEKQKHINGAIQTYEEALKIRKAILGESHLDVGRLMHKIGRLVSSLQDFATANIYMKRASEIYSMNKLAPDHAFQREMEKDNADIRVQLAFGK